MTDLNKDIGIRYGHITMTMWYAFDHLVCLFDSSVAVTSIEKS